MKVLVLGTTGMLGYSLFSNLNEYSHLDVYGTVRSISGKEHFFEKNANRLIDNIDVNFLANIEKTIQLIQPNVVLNCIGLIKQHEISKQYISAIQINSLLPHQLASICDKYNARLIHFSTDCVFDGKLGNYQESDLPTAMDLYGRSKYLGEVSYGQHLTLRTSIIGHELTSSVSLVDWFLSQENEANGFSKAIFSGLPTCYIAKILAELIFINPALQGMYHLSAEPIDKYTLISLVAKYYNKKIKINKDTDFVIDRSLDSTRFKKLTGFIPPSWSWLIEYMHNDYQKRYVL
ncbi:SDR family oxidoreductase [Providencia rettgeri]|uniref:dTDP-4-dehydrorhamnose reductase family protein n=1 Tax=Providencia TaxID=586 RepID=UPI002349CDE6|nr:SDR family oxidoreductase [Providencia sp. PROV164]ELR5239604.1 SDR family oxidoreductase [Providencia rettgeri]ELZ5939668.1 SDR family oxidoreductase [Providencia stuartii]